MPVHTSREMSALEPGVPSPPIAVEGGAPSVVEGGAPSPPGVGRVGHEREILAAVTAAVAVGLAVMTAFGYYAFIFKTAVVPALLVVALATKRLGRFVEDWAVFLALVVLFDFVRGLVFAAITHFDLPVYMMYAIEWERWLCGGHVLPVLLQQWRAGQPGAEMLDRLFTIVHALHFATFLIFGLAVWLLRPGEFRRYTTAILLLIYLGVLCYLLVPTVPPWMAAERFGVLPPIEHVTVHIYNAKLPTLQAAFDVNPIAAMPSLHAALPILCALIALFHFGRWGMPVAAYAILAVVGIVYLGEHYVVDALAGAVLALGVFAAVYWGPRLAWHWPARLGRVGAAGSAAVIVIAAELVGALTLTWVRPFEITPAFAAREMVGRTSGAHLTLGRLALRGGDVQTARDHFERAAALSQSEDEHRDATLLLDSLVARRAGGAEAGAAER